jgi:hypothetical protein
MDARTTLPPWVRKGSGGNFGTLRLQNTELVHWLRSPKAKDERHSLALPYLSGHIRWHDDAWREER